MMKVLIVESEFLHQDTWVGNAVERLADALSQQNVTVIKSTSFDDGFAILSSNEAIDCLMFSYQMEHPDEHQNVRQLIGKLHERQQNVPVFLLGDREKASPQWIATCWSLSMNSPGFWKIPPTLSPDAPLPR